MKAFLSNIWLVLVLGAAFGAMLGGAQTVWGPQIARNNQAVLNRAVFDVVPGAEKIEKRQLGLHDVYKCFDADGQLAGWALPASDFGFADKIHLVIGLSPDADTITGLKVTKNTETPGLGNRIEEEQWRSQYVGLDAARQIEVRKGKRNRQRNEIHAITGATISSLAVTKIANDIIAEVRPKLDQLR